LEYATIKISLLIILYSNFVVLLPSLKFTSTFNPVFIDEFPSDVNDIDSVLKENSIKTINYIDKNDNVLSHHRNVLINIFIIYFGISVAELIIIFTKWQCNLEYATIKISLLVSCMGDTNILFLVIKKPKLGTIFLKTFKLLYVFTYWMTGMWEHVVESCGMSPCSIILILWFRC
jgi:hypothetical protein